MGPGAAVIRADAMKLSLVEATAVAEGGAREIPTTFSLAQNYPNPFNPVTTIEFTLPRAAFVTIQIYSVLGEEVATLVSGQYGAGRFSTRWDAGNHPSGVYFCRIRAGDWLDTKKMLLAK
jgi:hypothetical protein